MKFIGLLLFVYLSAPHASGVAQAGIISSFTGLGSLGGSEAQAFGLNAGGAAVGSATNAFGCPHAFSNFGCAIADLAIGAALQAAGSGSLAGVEHAIVLNNAPAIYSFAAVAAPEPDTATLALIGLALIVSSKIRFRPRLPRQQRGPTRELP